MFKRISSLFLSGLTAILLVWVGAPEPAFAASNNFLVSDSGGERIGSESENTGTLSAKVTEAGTTQLITVGIDDAFDAGQWVRFRIASTGSDEVVIHKANGDSVNLGSAVYEINATNSTMAFLVKGVDDTSEDGEESATFTFTVDDSNHDVITNEPSFVLTVNNADNEGSSGNRAPSEPTQRYPTNGGEIASDENLQWEHAYDADADALTYLVCVAEESASVDTCVSVDEDELVAGSGVASMSWPVLLALVLSILLFKFGRRSRRTKAMHIIQFAPQKQRKLPSALSVLMLFFLVACGNTALLDALDVSPRPSVQVSLSSFPNVSAGNTYNWRVYADDGNGNVTPTSSEFSFEVTAP